MSTFERLHRLIGTCAATQLFFIGGSMKSGTTWLQLLLDAHPQIVCKGEGHAEQFAAAWPQACLTVRYEALLDDAASVLQQVLAFLGVAADSGEIAQCCDATRFERLSAGRSPGEENRGSFFRNGTQGNWREHLDAAASHAFAEAASPWLERMGYL